MSCSRRKHPYAFARLTVATALWFAWVRANGATNAAEEIGVPKLAPPYPELAPTFWELHGTTILAVGFTGILAAVMLYRWLRRPKPVVLLPSEVRARRALEELRAKPEDGAVLSQISRNLRDYFRAVFKLPPEELTTEEFCHALASHEQIGAELTAAVADFLRRCDQHKFSARPFEPLNAAARALELAALGEARLASLQQAATAAEPATSTQS